jgi:hypothetical protein
LKGAGSGSLNRPSAADSRHNPHTDRQKPSKKAKIGQILENPE